MRYESLMFTKTQLEYYRLYDKLCKLPRKNYPIRDLATLMDSSYSKIKYTLERISEIMEDIDETQAAHFRQSKNLPLDQVTVSLTEFRFIMLRKQSIAFQFLLWLLTTPDPQLKDFLTKHYVSQSTLTRNLRGLQKYLKTYGVHLSVTNASLETKDELMLRQCLFYLFWMGTKGDTTIFEPYEIDDALLPKLVAQIPEEHHYISYKIYKLKLIIQYFRLQQGHRNQENLRARSIFLENPLFDLTLCQDNPLISEDILWQESGSILINTVTSPNFVNPKSPLIPARKVMLQEKVPLLVSLADDFLHYFEEYYFSGDIPSEKRQVLHLNMTQAAAGIWVYGGTFPNLHYFLVQEEEVSSSNRIFDEQVRTFFASEKVTPYLHYRSLFPVIEKSFGHILRPYYMEHMTWTKLKVGVVVEPNSILHDRILLLLRAIYFVDAEAFSPADADKYDLVIASTAVFKQDYPEIPFYLWNITTKDEEASYLYTWLQEAYFRHNDQMRFI